MRKHWIQSLVLLAVGKWSCGQAGADEITIAVATNFTAAMNDLVERFELQTEHTVLVSSGSTGNHYAQIKNGAPFEAFFAADSERPRLLEQEGNAVAGSRFLYAVGRLVLWSPEPGYVESGRARNARLPPPVDREPDLAPHGAPQVKPRRLGSGSGSCRDWPWDKTSAKPTPSCRRATPSSGSSRWPS
jgi:molybdate transport system substrate-binding protein